MSQTEMSPLEALLRASAENAGAMPAVNPPEAKKVLETQTAPEVAGKPEPEVDVPPVPAPVAKPAAVAAAEAAPKPRRTAKVVQEELDGALARIAELEANREVPGNEPQVKALQADLAKANAEIAELKKSEGLNEKAVTYIKSLEQQLKASQEGEAAARTAGPLSTRELCEALAHLGFTVSLTFGGES
jgi:hypothetical protein